MMCADVKRRKCEDEKMICVGVKGKDVKVRRCEGGKVICADGKMRKGEDEKLIYALV